MAIKHLTEAAIHALPPNSGNWRDTKVKGLFVFVHKSAKTYVVQGDSVRTQTKGTVKKKDRALRSHQSGRGTAAGGEPVGPNPKRYGPAQAEAIRDAHDIADDARDPPGRTAGPVGHDVVSYRYHVEHYVPKSLRSKAVADISREDVRELLETLERDSGRTTASGVLRTAPALLNTARRIDKAIGENPIDALRVPTVPRRTVEAIDLADWRQRIDALSPQRRDLNLLMMFTGLRRTSAVTIRRADVNLEHGVISVQHMKSQRPFILPLSDYLVEMLRARMTEDEPLGSEWLWPSASASGHIVEPKEKGLPSPHILRHLYRTFAASAAGVPYAESALLLDQRLPGASGGYVHPAHLSEHLRGFQQRVTDHLLSFMKPDDAGIGFRKSALRSADF